MSGISGYILTITGVILISVIVELVMSEGQMSKYIRSIFSFFIVGVIIAPLPSLISTDGIASVFDFEDFQIQESYISALDASKAKTLAYELQNELVTEGYTNIEIEIVMSNGEIKSVAINLKDMNVHDVAEHKDITKIKGHITSKVMDKLGIKKEKVVYED